MSILSGPHRPKIEEILRELVGKREEVKTRIEAGQNVTRETGERDALWTEFQAARLDARTNPDREPTPRTRLRR